MNATEWLGLKELVLLEFCLRNRDGLFLDYMTDTVTVKQFVQRFPFHLSFNLKKKKLAFMALNGWLNSHGCMIEELWVSHYYTGGDIKLGVNIFTNSYANIRRLVLTTTYGPFDNDLKNFILNCCNNNLQELTLYDLRDLPGGLFANIPNNLRRLRIHRCHRSVVSNSLIHFLCSGQKMVDLRIVVIPEITVEGNDCEVITTENVLQILSNNKKLRSLVVCGNIRATCNMRVIKKEMERIEEEKGFNFNFDVVEEDDKDDIINQWFKC